MRLSLLNLIVRCLPNILSRGSFAFLAALDQGVLVAGPTEEG
ncbi:MAG TPA: hypothetical protein VHU91_06900 [Mycobacteriales bacterium]|nr:hypothetical protein [Mycobacteriales bacterium]